MKRRLFFLGLAAAVALQAQMPVSDNEFFQKSPAELVRLLGARKPNLAVPLEQEINEESKSLDVITTFPTPVWICRGCGINSHPALGITIDLDQLERIQQQSRDVLRWLLAHEKAHQVQFRSYSAAIVNEDEPERQVYEAQADLLGAKYLIETMGPAENKPIVEALRTAYDLGVEQYAMVDHPSRDSRLTAVRLGLAAGMVTKMRQLGGAPALGSAAVLIQKLDIRPGEDLLAWSLRTSRRIVNYRRPAIVDLVLSEEDFVYSKDSAHPVVSYWTTYENRGSRSMRVNAEIQCVAASRDDPEDLMKWQLISVMNHDFDLNPGGKKTISGSLQWYGDDKLMPRVISPPSPTALILVEYLGPDGKPQNAGRPKPLNAEARAGSRNTFSSSLNRILQASLVGFLSLRAGPGRKIDDMLVYPSQVNFPDAIRTRVWVPDTGADAKPYVSATLYRTKNSAEARVRFQKVVGAVKETLDPLKTWSVEDSGEDSYALSQGKIKILVERNFHGEQYEVVLRIRL